MTGTSPVDDGDGGASPRLDCILSFENADRAERGVQLRDRVGFGQDGHAFVAFELIQQRGLALTAGDQDRQPRVNPAQLADQSVSGRIGKPDVDDDGGEFALSRANLLLASEAEPATSDLKPSSSRYSAISICMRTSSSTTRMRAGAACMSSVSLSRCASAA